MIKSLSEIAEILNRPLPRIGSSKDERLQQLNEMELNTVVCKDGGVLRELYKSEWSGQISVRIIPPGKSTAGSLHHERAEIWWIAAGVATILLECPDGSMAQLSVEGPASRIIKVPAGTGHRVLNHGPDDVVLVWHSNKVYDPEKPDRYAWNSQVVG